MGSERSNDRLELHEGSGVVSYWSDVPLFIILTVGLGFYGARSSTPAIALITGLPLMLWTTAGLLGFPRRFKNRLTVDDLELVLMEARPASETHVALSSIDSITTSRGLLDKVCGYTTVSVWLTELDYAGEPVALELHVREPELLTTELSRGSTAPLDSHLTSVST